MKVLVIGGVAAGTKAAAKIKRLDRDREVKIITKGKDISYAGCGLPYYVGGVITDEASLVVNTPEKFTALTGVSVLTETEVTAVDFDAKSVTAVKDGVQTTESYDKLIITTGASPIVPKADGIDLPGVFVMRTPQDAKDLRSYIKDNNCRNAVVAGAGFIGLEIAENLKALGLSVTVIDIAPQIMPNVFDEEMADFARKKLKSRGIRIMTGTPLTSIVGETKAEGIMAGSMKIPGDVVVVALGVKPNTAFLSDTALETDRGAIVTDEKMQTNIPDVYSAGDCAIVKNMLTGKAARSPMGSTANISARAMAYNVAGGDAVYGGCLGTGVVKLLDGLNGGRTGLTEAQAKAEGYNPVSVVCIADDKAHYYPSSSPFIMKVIADKDSHALLGLQIFGAGNVDKVVDIAALGISQKLKIEDYNSVDFAYAPPFSTAIHPFVTACYVLENKLCGALESFTPAEYAHGAAKGYTVVDAQAVQTIPGAKHVVLETVDGEISGLGKEEKILIVCTKGKRAYMLQQIMKSMGYVNTKVLEGGVTFNTVKAEFKDTLPAAEIKRLKGLGCLQDKRFPDAFNIRVITRNGKITAAEHMAVAEACEKFGSGEVTMTTRLTLEVQCVPYEKVADCIEFLNNHGLLTGGTGSLVRPVVSCKGTTCQYGLIDTFDLSEKLHERFYLGWHTVTLPHKFKIAVGGCPNNCVKPDLNDLGIIGQRIPMPDLDKCRGCKVCQVVEACPIKTAKVVDGKIDINPTECNHCGRCVGKCPFKALEDPMYGYKVYIGGRWGKKVKHGIPLGKIFTSEEEVMDIVEKAILLFRDEGITGERFADTIERLGFEYVEDKLLNGVINKEDVLNKTVIGGAIC